MPLVPTSAIDNHSIVAPSALSNLVRPGLHAQRHVPCRNHRYCLARMSTPRLSFQIKRELL